MENLRNQDGIGAKELLVVSFGTSYEASRSRTIGAVEDALAAVFPEYSVRRAFTSGMILRVIRKRDGLVIDSVEEALERAEKNGVRELLVQPTHLMNGREYDKLSSLVQAHAAAFEKVSIAAPLLSSEEDFKAVANAVIHELSPHMASDTAMILMGHGTDVEANTVYHRMQQTLSAVGNEHMYVATVESEPTFDAVLEQVRSKGYRRAVLMPLMVVAGDHATNDMAGEEPDSWSSRLKVAGIEPACILKGIGELPEIHAIYAAHAKAAM